MPIKREFTSEPTAIDYLEWAKEALNETQETADD